MHRLVPEEIGDDRAFLYATGITYDAAEDRWTIRIDPESHLAGPEGDVDIETLRNATLQREQSGTKTRYIGKILFSAGVALRLDGNGVLLRRGENAETDPGKWTSPAGRCDHPPLETALKEFYEELVVLDGKTRQPVFITVDGPSGEFESVYRSSLSAAGIETDPEEWVRFEGVTPEGIREEYATVVTEYGDERFESDMLAYFNEAANTLELRLAVSVETPPETDASTLHFEDVEFDRDIARFSREELETLRAAGELVATDSYLVSNDLFP